MTPDKFVENAPLYTRIEIKDFRPPDSITRMCTSARCKKETTWLRGAIIESVFKDARPEIYFKAIGYTCGLCSESSFAVFYELLDWKQVPNANRWNHLAVRKIGQVPPQEISISAELNSRLGSTTAHYKKALICRGQNYGIAAMAYLRRVVDEKTDELVDVMVELSRTYNVSEEQIANLVNAKTEIRYEEKLKVAAELIPEALRPGGVNPLGQLYRLTSIGLHGKTDDECIAIFDELRADFEYVFRYLHLQAEERRQFARRVQERAGKGFAADQSE